MTAPKESIRSLRGNLTGKRPETLKMIIGLDGFVDEIIHPVNTRDDFQTYERINKISELGDRIQRAAGLSTNIELVPVGMKLGGNGPILSNALIEYGVGLTYVGAIGSPAIHPVFVPMSERCTVYSTGEPGHTDAMEFLDGKLLLCKTIAMTAITWAKILEVAGGLDKFTGMIAESDLFGMENWTMIPYMSDIWGRMIAEVFPKLPDRAVKPIAFFDLADPEKRSKADILEAMRLIGAFEQKFRSVLGLNEKEAYEIAEVFGIHIDGNLPAADRLKRAVTGVYEKLGIYCLVVHPTKEAVCCVSGDYYQQAGPYCKSPVLTTGAGDNFNAGFCLGTSLGLSPQDSLTLGVCTSGYYVRNAKSPTLRDLLTFLDHWEEDKLS